MRRANGEAHAGDVFIQRALPLHPAHVEVAPDRGAPFVARVERYGRTRTRQRVTRGFAEQTCHAVCNAAPRLRDADDDLPRRTGELGEAEDAHAASKPPKANPSPTRPTLP